MTVMDNQLVMHYVTLEDWMDWCKKPASERYGSVVCARCGTSTGGGRNGTFSTSEVDATCTTDEELENDQHLIAEGKEPNRVRVHPSGPRIQNILKEAVAPINEMRRTMGLAPIRPSWDEYFLEIAIAVAKRADCTRSKVGAVVVDVHKRVVGTGYNGAYPGGPSCLAGECPRGKMTNEQVAPGTSYDTGAGACIALHAEQNALLYSSRDSRMGGTLYITREPCDGCMRMLQGSGLARVAWLEFDIDKSKHDIFEMYFPAGRPSYKKVGTL